MDVDAVVAQLFLWVWGRCDDSVMVVAVGVVNCVGIVVSMGVVNCMVIVVWLIVWVSVLIVVWLIVWILKLFLCVLDCSFCY